MPKHDTTLNVITFKGMNISKPTTTRLNAYIMQNAKTILFRTNSTFFIYTSKNIYDSLSKLF